MSENSCQLYHHHHHHPQNKYLWGGLFLALALTAAFVSFNPDVSALTDKIASASLVTVFVLGVIGASSHCIMLVGGILLTAIKNYQQHHYSRHQIIGTFLLGRLFSFALGGYLLGSLGQIFQLNSLISTIFMFLTSILMLVFGLDFLGLWCWHHHFEHLFGDHHLPTKLWWLLAISALTFFIPCSFTNTAQLLALSSGSAWQGCLIMTIYVLGTTLPLAIIGYTGAFFEKQSQTHQLITATFGWLIIIIALISFNETLESAQLPHLEILEHHHEALIDEHTLDHN